MQFRGLGAPLPFFANRGREVSGMPLPRKIFEEGPRRPDPTQSPIFRSRARLPVKLKFRAPKDPRRPDPIQSSIFRGRARLPVKLKFRASEDPRRPDPTQSPNFRSRARLPVKLKFRVLQPVPRTLADQYHTAPDLQK